MRRAMVLVLVFAAVGAVIAVSVALPGSPLSPFPPPDDGDGLVLPLETLWRSQTVSFGHEEPTFLVIQSPGEWEALWARAGREAPDVDLANRTVLVALHGRAPTSGYDIEIEAAVPSDGGLVVSVTLTRPGPTCATLQVLTHPIHMVSLPKTEGPFEFQTETVVHRCT